MNNHIRITKVEENNAYLFYDFLPEELELRIPNRFCLGAAYDSFAVGVVVFLVDEVMTTVEWLYVDEKYRRKGVAGQLIENIKVLMNGSSIMGLSAVFPMENIELNSFFEGVGFGVFPGDISYTVSMKAISDSSKASKILSRSTKDEIVAVEEMTTEEKRQLLTFLKTEIASDNLFYKCDIQYSFVAYKNGKITGCLICSGDWNNNINIDLLYNKSETVFAALSLLKELILAIDKDRSGKMNLHFVAADPEMIDFVTYATGYKAEDMDPAPTCFAMMAL